MTSGTTLIRCDSVSVLGLTYRWHLFIRPEQPDLLAEGLAVGGGKGDAGRRCGAYQATSLRVAHFRVVPTFGHI